MLRTTRLDCRKCGNVVEVEPRIFPDRVEVRTPGATLHERVGGIEVQCGKCRKVLAVLDPPHVQAG